jgi:hypothetical protein
MQIKKASIKTGFNIHSCGHNEIYLCPLMIENLVLIPPLFFSLRRNFGEAMVEPQAAFDSMQRFEPPSLI